MLALVKSLSETETNGDYIHETMEQLQLVTTRLKKISPRLTHIFRINNTNGYQFYSWILYFRSKLNLVIADLYILIIVKDNFLLDYSQIIELVRSNIILIIKYTPRMYFFLKRGLNVNYNIPILTCVNSMKIKNGASQGYFFLKARYGGYNS